MGQLHWFSAEIGRHLSKKLPPYLNSAIHFQTGDIRNFEYPEGQFGFILHAATQASKKLNIDEPLTMFETIVNGTWRVLEFARSCNVKKILFTSSGAVYGKQPPNLTHIDETYQGAPIICDTSSAYAEGKHAAELLCTLYAQQYNLDIKIARLFAFVGPYLPLNAHFAIGNFIRDGLRGGPIQVEGDGTTIRSYLYAADMTIWLWTIFLKGKACYPYNIGSENALTIQDLAKQVANLFDLKPKCP